MQLRVDRIAVIFLISLLVLGQVQAADFSAPLIDLPTVKFPPEATAPLQIKAIVDDDSGIDSVTLYYRIIGRNTHFTAIALTPSKGNDKEYSTNIPATDWQGKSIEFYVEARDIANNVTQEPFPNNPKKAIFRPQTAPDATPFKGSSGEQGFEFGLGAASAFLSIDDPVGSTGVVVTPNFSLIAAYTPIPNWRIWSDLSYQNFSLAYSGTQIGQQVSSIHLDLIVQRSLLPTFGIEGWIGLGLGLGKNTATDRATINSTGNLQDKFADRDELNSNMLLYFAMDVGTVQNRRIGLHGRFYKSIKNDIEGFVVGLYGFLTPHRR